MMTGPLLFAGSPRGRILQGNRRWINTNTLRSNCADQQLFEQTSKIENAARDRQAQPFQINPRYPSFCRELEAVTLQLARSRAPAPKAMAADGESR